MARVLDDLVRVQGTRRRVGLGPLLGDPFDLGWKANRRNLALLERLVADPAAVTRASRLLVGTVLAATLGVTVATAAGAFVLFRWVLSVVGLPI